MNGVVVFIGEFCWRKIRFGVNPCIGIDVIRITIWGDMRDLFIL